MVRLMDNPDAISALAPVYERETLFLVLQGPTGWMLREIAALDTVAMQWARRDFAEPIRHRQPSDCCLWDRATTSWLAAIGSECAKKLMASYSWSIDVCSLSDRTVRTMACIGKELEHVNTVLHSLGWAKTSFFRPTAPSSNR